MGKSKNTSLPNLDKPEEAKTEFVKSDEVAQKETDAILDDNFLPAVVEKQESFSQLIDAPSQQKESIDLIITKYVGASTLQITPEQEKKLAVAVDLLDINVRPDGLIYYPQVFVRDRLNDAFGRGAWAIIEHQVVKDEEHNKIYFEGSLYVRGCFISKAIGESNYFPKNQKGEPNKMFSWASAHESAKSDCIVRCGKDLGIGKELWQPRFSKDFLKDFCIKVWRKDTGNTNQNGAWNKGSYQWRMKDSEPFYDEKESDIQSQQSERLLEQSKKETKKEPIINFEAGLKKAKSILELKSAYKVIPKEHQTEKLIATAKKCSALLKATLLIPINEQTTTFDLIDLLNNIESQKELNEFLLLNSKMLDEEFGANDQIRAEFNKLKLRIALKV